MPTPLNIRPTSGAYFKRLGWLLACVLAGALVGLIGRTLTGSDAWFLAVPGAIVAVWLFVADPVACAARRGMLGRRRPVDDPREP